MEGGTEDDERTKFPLRGRNQRGSLSRDNEFNSILSITGRWDFDMRFMPIYFSGD